MTQRRKWIQPQFLFPAAILLAFAAVIIASSDMDEILEVSDRVAIIANGRIVKIMEHDEFDREKMLYYAMGDEKQ